MITSFGWKVQHLYELIHPEVLVPSSTYLYICVFAHVCVHTTCMYRHVSVNKPHTTYIQHPPTEVYMSVCTGMCLYMCRHVNPQICVHENRYIPTCTYLYVWGGNWEDQEMLCMWFNKHGSKHLKEFHKHTGRNLWKRQVIWKQHLINCEELVKSVILRRMPNKCRLILLRIKLLSKATKVSMPLVMKMCGIINLPVRLEKYHSDKMVVFFKLKPG